MKLTNYFYAKTTITQKLQPLSARNLLVVSRLVAISKASHSTHDTENVVVRGVDVDSRGRRGANRVVGHREEQRGVIDTR